MVKIYQRKLSTDSNLLVNVSELRLYKEQLVDWTIDAFVSQERKRKNRENNAHR